MKCLSVLDAARVRAACFDYRTSSASPSSARVCLVPRHPASRRRRRRFSIVHASVK
ncbi:hypothetical protein HYPSUDRAFT_38901 [Hypholoma sublateritium FD-334 SS-4]|uniref:Uncharacterized protein n=1 Tax=Hypholoma sublateritium (strain FD-334 SS-4) TaxID=945553 RepID=A0A0D2P6Y3_HYPSF|nr:hypothetical protein HYPSUDRAFT_38901 [Hypholoma sublateritium FD-334 SS-4]